MTYEYWLRSLGFLPRVVVADGRWRRCPTSDHPRKLNGAYKLALDGRIGWAQDWATMQKAVQWTSQNHDRAPIPYASQKDMRRQHEQMLADQARASERAAAYYFACAPLRNGHEYLTKQGLDMAGAFGLRIDADGWIVVPAFRKGKVISYQRISPDGQKRFAPGAPIVGTHYTIKRPRATVTVLVEGLATGMAVFACIPESQVLVTWSAGNLARAWSLPGGWRVIGADNDHGTEAKTGKNPGVEAGKKASQLLSCGFSHPRDIVGTDWADFRRERREKGRRPHLVDREIRSLIMAEARYCEATGAYLTP
jgi:putative DNA primase/helicase